MHPHQTEFIDLARLHNVLKFGEFTLKSGRISPYFFNAGAFSSGRALATLGRCYARSIVDSGLAFDVLFGPAYKGIPLVAVSAAALADHHNIDSHFAYDRKEAKGHGEGGSIVGAPIGGRVLILDDVITAGTAVRHAVRLIRDAGGEAAGIVLALDREERGETAQSAVQELAAELQAPVASIASLGDLIALLAEDEALRRFLPAMEQYRRHYGV